MDENIGTNDRVYFTGILGEQNFHNPNVLPLTGELKYQNNRLLGATWQHTFSPNIINELRFGNNWMKWRNGSDATTGPNYGADLGFANVPGNSALWGVPNLILGPYNNIGNTNSGWTQKENNYQLVENLKITHGKHTVNHGY